MRNRPRLLPSIKACLICLHVDLFTIDKKVNFYEGVDDLTSFEKLVLVFEDRRFFRHGGFDFIALLREFTKICRWRRHGGASTIDMQFVRTATGYKEKTIKRKLYEMLLATIIQWRYTKVQILRSYLDCAFFGSKMIGANVASYKAYERPLYKLSIEQSAQLAAMLVFPRPLRPQENWWQRIRQRSAYGLRRLDRFEKSFEKIPPGK